MSFWSHPDKLLKEHLREVYEGMVALHRDRRGAVRLSVDEEFLRIVAFSHDFGKYTGYFQNYIRTGKRDKNNLHHHSALGSFFAAWWLQREGYSPAHVLAGYLSVRNHHGSLKSTYDHDPYRFGKWLEDLKGKVGEISREMGIDVGEFLDIKTIEKVRKGLLRARHRIRRERNITAYLLTLYTYSLLLEADRRSAGGISEVERVDIPEDTVDRYRRIRFPTPRREIDRLRNALYEEVMGEFYRWEDIPKVITLTAPTGLGKTLLNLSLALKIRKLKEKELGFTPRVVYALPFTAIIDQAYAVLRDVLSTVVGEDYRRRPEGYLIRHHHLSSITYRAGGEEVPLNEALFYVEGWESEIILTTFVQLLEGMVGIRPSYLRRFHNLAGAVVILDEVQGIDRKHWETLRKVMVGMTELMGTTFVLSTATKPALLKGKEMVPNPRKYILNRTRLTYRPDLNTGDGVAEAVLERLRGNIGSAMVVLNTIQSSIDMYRAVKDGAAALGYTTFYLSSNVIPAHRLERIRRIKEMVSKGEKVLLVSTQVVEAGVDLDFDTVFRDLGPFDSMVQVAGRCNRNASKEMGDVLIFHLKRNGVSLAAKVYGATSKGVSEDLLSDNPTVEEREFPHLTEEYFNLLERRAAPDTEPLKGVLELDFGRVGGFRVVENLPGYTDVFVQVDRKAKEVWERFVKEVIMEEDFRKRYLNFIRLRAEFRAYVVSVPEKYTVALPDERGIKYVPHDSLARFYDPTTGFVRDERGFEIW